MRAILIDLDGVIYQEGRLIPGAAETIDWLRGEGIPHLFLTNTTSRPRRTICERLTGFGITITPEELLTPVIAARHWLETHATGPTALFVPEATREDLRGIEWLPDGAEQGATALVLGDLGTGWDFATLNRAFRLLMENPPPTLIALGMTRYWQTPRGLQLDVGAFAKALEYASGREALVLGKPAAAFFDQASDMIGAELAASVMIGDDILGDVDGAQRAGLRGLLVRTGKFRPADLNGTIQPDALLDSIAALPAWWGENS